MKAFLQSQDDGISSDMWIRHAAFYVNTGRPVFAMLKGAAAYSGVVGMGDDLPSIRGHLWSSAENLRVVPVNKGQDSAHCVAFLRALPDDAVVLWDVSPSDADYFGAGWPQVIAACAQSPCDMLMACAAEAADYDLLERDSVNWIPRIAWDYASGSRLLLHTRGDWFGIAFPLLSRKFRTVVDRSARFRNPTQWQAAWPEGAVAISGARSSIPELAQAAGAMAYSLRRPVSAFRSRLLKTAPVAVGLMVALWLLHASTT